VLVIAGTRFFLDLNRARRRGIRVVQRLDGINWVQRVKWSGVKYSVRAEYGNFMLSLIRKRFADRVIYQSQFIRNGGRIGTALQMFPPRSSSMAWIWHDLHSMKVRTNVPQIHSACCCSKAASRAD
jgi:hypothetical protein